MVTALDAPASRKKAIMAEGMPVVSRTSLKVARLNFQGKRDLNGTERTYRANNFL